MINLSEKATRDFIKIYEQEYNVQLDYEEARSMAYQFLKFFALVSKRGKNENINKVKE